MNSCGNRTSLLEIFNFIYFVSFSIYFLIEPKINIMRKLIRYNLEILLVNSMVLELLSHH